MIYSKDGLDLTKQFEGCRLTAYQDSTGVWTVGYGHTQGVYAGQTITLEQAEDFLIADVLWAQRVVNIFVTVPLLQAEFDALVDFTFNLGSGNFLKSTLLKLLNQGNYSAAANEFERWDKAGGVVVAGLLRRREAEAEEFMKGETETV